MNPMILQALMSMGPALLGKLGIFGPDPQKQLAKKLEALLSPQNLAKQTDTLYQQNVGSPAFAQGQGTIAAGANQSAANFARAAGNLGPGGTSAIMQSLGPSLVGSQMAGLRTNAFQSAQNTAQNQIQQQAQQLGNLGAQPSQGQQLAGGGMAAFAQMLQQMLAGGRQDFGQFLNQRPQLPNNMLQAANQAPFQLPQRRVV